MLNLRSFLIKSWLWCVVIILFLTAPCKAQSNEIAHADNSPDASYALSSARASKTLKYPENISGVWENTTNVPAYDFNGHVRRESTFKLNLMQDSDKVTGTFLMRVYMSGGVVQKYTRVAGTYREGFLRLKTTGIIKEGCYAPENVSGLYDLNFEGRITDQDGTLILDGHYDFATQKSFQTRNGRLVFSNAVLGLRGPVKIFAQRTVAMKPEPKDVPEKIQAVVPNAVKTFKEADTVFSHVLFKQSETDFLSSKDSLEVVRLGNLLQTYPGLKVELNGYTENRGTLRENIELSEKRSEFLKEYLVNKKNISGDRIITKGFGPYNPVGDNRNERTRMLNRRVEIKVYAN